MVFEQTFLKPGRYHVGNGAYREFSRDDLKAFVDGTRKLLADGNHVPVLLEHAAPGSKDGAPRERRAEQVRHGAGWLKAVRLGDDGAAVHSLEITDAAIAGKIKDGSIKFTSPELRAAWKDGKGREYANVFAHVALTHKPRATDQGELKPGESAKALQFSLDDWEPIQMADEDDETKGKGDDEKPDFSAEKEEKPENPDMPDTGEPGKDAQRMEAIVAHLAELGVVMPTDTDQDTFQDRLLTSLMTAAAHKKKADAEKQANEQPLDDGSGGPKEEQPPLQFSLADAESGKLPNKLLAKVIRQEHGTLTSRLDAMIEESKITPALRTKLLECPAALQFSDEGEHLTAFTLPQVVALLEETTLPGQALTVEQFSLLTSEEQPDADAHQINGDVSPAEAKKLADEFAAKYPNMVSRRKAS